MAAFITSSASDFEVLKPLLYRLQYAQRKGLPPRAQAFLSYIPYATYSSFWSLLFSFSSRYCYLPLHQPTTSMSKHPRLHPSNQPSHDSNANTNNHTNLGYYFDVQPPTHSRHTHLHHHIPTQSGTPTTFTCTFCFRPSPSPPSLVGTRSARLACSSCHRAILDLSIC